MNTNDKKRDLPGVDFVRVFPLKKSSSSSSSKSPPPTAACFGAACTLAFTGLLSSLLTKESESFGEPNRLLSAGDRKYFKIYM